MKCIILAAGQGSRLFPYTKDQPKCMVPFKGIPIIDYLLHSVHKNPITDIGIVSGFQHTKLKQHVSEKGLNVSFFNNERYMMTNMVYSLFEAESFFTDDLIISYSDIIYHPHVLRTLIESPDPISVIIDRNWLDLWKLRMANPLEDVETLQLNDQLHITDIGQKPSTLEEIQGQYIGLIKIKKSIMNDLSSFYHSLLSHRILSTKEAVDKLDMTSFLRLIISHLSPINACICEGKWLEIDSVSDLKAYENTDFFDTWIPDFFSS